MGKVWITDYVADPDVEASILGDALASEPLDEVEVLLVWHQHIDAAYINRFPALRGVVRYGVGYDMLDLDALAERGIVACNTPDYGTEEVADTAIAMILNLTRGVSRYDALCRTFSDGTWQENTLPGIRRTSDLTLGVVGAGRIGGSVLLRARDLRFKTVFFDPYVPRGHEKLIGAQRTDSLAELLQVANIVSLHVPLTSETRGMVTEDFLRTMKPASMLVNTARGATLSDIEVLHQPLRTGHLSGVALDVLPEEPPPTGPLIDAWRAREKWLDGKLIINPHTAYYSSSSYEEMRLKAAKNALRIIEGHSPYNILWSK